MPEIPHAETSGRRFAALVLPELLSELALTALGRPLKAKRARPPPLGVVMTEEEAAGVSQSPSASESDASEKPPPLDELKATALLDAVNDTAKSFGVREGQSIAEACALVANLVVRQVPRAEVQTALGRIAEMALAFGPSVAIEAPDTVWVDVTGTGHLWGGEPLLAVELVSRVRALGHVARISIASGARIAQALSRWAPRAAQSEGALVVPAERSAEAMSALPVAALPLECEAAQWLVRLGLLTIGDLARLPRAALAARLGPNAKKVLALCEGQDSEPLVTHQPARVLVERLSWEDSVVGSEPLLFALRGMAARLSGRLEGRGEAAQALVLRLFYDRSVARLEGVEPSRVLHFELAAPLWREDELRRVIAARLTRTTLEAPCMGLELEVPSISAAPGRQLDFSRVMAGVSATCRGAESLPVVVAELVSDVGKEQVGVLKLLDSHRLEQKSVLGPALPRRTRQGVVSARSRARRGPKKAARQANEMGSPNASFPNAPTRLLPRPLLLSVALRPGVTFAIERRLFTIEHVAFEYRLAAVEWWTHAPVERDYLRLKLRDALGMTEALVFVDRNSGERYLHAIAD